MVGTLQNRLPQELRLKGITDMEAANRFLAAEYLPAHNARFAITPSGEGSAFVPFAGDAGEILCIHEERIVSKDNTVRYRNHSLQIPADSHRHHYVKARVRVHACPDGQMAVFHGPGTWPAIQPKERRQGTRTDGLREPLRPAEPCLSSLFAYGSQD